MRTMSHAFNVGFLSLVLFVSSAGAGPTVPEARARVEKYVSEMISTFMTGRGERLQAPRSLGKGTVVERLKNQAFFYWFLKKLPQVMDQNTAPNGQVNMAAAKQDLGSEIQSLDASYLRNLVDGGLYDNIREGILDPESRDGLFFQQGHLDRATARFKAQIEADKGTFGTEFFPRTVVAKGAVDVIGTFVQALMRSQAPANWDAMYAIGMLHPITDLVTDRGDLKPESFKKIYGYLRHQPVQATTSFEKLVFAYIDRIYSAFSIEQHPLMHEILPWLLEEQLKSAQNRSTETEDVLRSAFLRGGLSSIAFAYPALGSMDDWEFRAYFVGGAIYQLLDDLTDIKTDKVETSENGDGGIPSVWTQEALKSKSIRSTLKGFFALEKDFEDSSAKTIDEGGRRQSHEATLKIHERGFNNILLMAHLLNSGDPEVKDALKFVKPHLSVRTGLPLQVIESIQNVARMNQGDYSDLTQDEGFNYFVEQSLIGLLFNSKPTCFEGLSFTEILRRLRYPDWTLRGKLLGYVERARRFAAKINNRVIEANRRDDEYKLRRDGDPSMLGISVGWITSFLINKFMGVQGEYTQGLAMMGPIIGTVAVVLANSIYVFGRASKGLYNYSPHKGLMGRYFTLPSIYREGLAIIGVSTAVQYCAKLAGEGKLDPLLHFLGK